MARAPKKEKFHTEAPHDVYELLSIVTAAHHHDLSDSRFLILMKHGGWKSKGRSVLGRFKVLGDDFRSTWQKDAVLYLNAELWYQMSDGQKRYVLDQALYSLTLKYDRHENIKEAADGRPLLGTVAPDVEAYVDVIRRHGPVVGEIKRLALALKETNQMTIEDVSDEPEALPEPREGVRGTVNSDGTVDLEEYDERNQIALPVTEGEEEDEE